MSIPVISIPGNSFRVARPTTEPLWDTGYTVLGRRASFFQNPTNFEYGDLSSYRIGRTAKVLSDTNSVTRGGMPKGRQFLLDRIVVYPSTDGVHLRELAAYQEEVEEYRQASVLELSFSGMIHSWFPLRDVMPNFAFYRDMKEREAANRPNDFDPLEAPYLTYRVGVDVRIAGQPIVLGQCEAFSISIIAPDRIERGGIVGIRCYLVGVMMKEIMG